MVLASLLFYGSFAYDLTRTDVLKLLMLFGALFFLCYKLIQFEKWNYKFLLASGILFRLVFLFAEPNLSQDFNRFVWDGNLLLLGINPYLFLPDDLILQADLAIANARELHAGMGSLSAANYSNYPPVNQLLFALAAWIGGKSILATVMASRVMIIFADIGIFYVGRKLLRQVNRSPHLIFWYFLNPLILIELTGNLHFEGVMLFFFICSLYLLSLHKWIWAAFPYAISISVKLIPLLFLPLFITHLGIKKSALFYGVVGGCLVICFLPFYSPQFIHNYMQTIGLWFSNFEFNAGLYNLIKQIALQLDVKPWELIKDYGKITPYLVIIIILATTFLRRNQNLGILIGSMLLVLSAYYFLASTVHPWYVIFLVLLAIYTDFRYPIAWSAFIILSYTAYANPEFKENLALLFVEYFLVIGFLCYEIIRYKGQKLVIRKN